MYFSLFACTKNSYVPFLVLITLINTNQLSADLNGNVGKNKHPSSALKKNIDTPKPSRSSGPTRTENRCQSWSSPSLVENNIGSRTNNRNFANVTTEKVSIDETVQKPSKTDEPSLKVLNIRNLVRSVAPMDVQTPNVSTEQNDNPGGAQLPSTSSLLPEKRVNKEASDSNPVKSTFAEKDKKLSNKESAKHTNELQLLRYISVFEWFTFLSFIDLKSVESTIITDGFKVQDATPEFELRNTLVPMDKCWYEIIIIGKCREITVMLKFNEWPVAQNFLEMICKFRSKENYKLVHKNVLSTGLRYLFKAHSKRIFPSMFPQF